MIYLGDTYSILWWGSKTGNRFLPIRTMYVCAPISGRQKLEQEYHNPNYLSSNIASPHNKHALHTLIA